MGRIFGFECSLLTLHMRQLVYIHHDIMKLANESHTPLTSSNYLTFGQNGPFFKLKVDNGLILKLLFKIAL